MRKICNQTTYFDCMSDPTLLREAGLRLRHSWFGPQSLREETSQPEGVPARWRGVDSLVRNCHGRSREDGRRGPAQGRGPGNRDQLLGEERDLSRRSPSARQVWPITRFFSFLRDHNQVPLSIPYTLFCLRIYMQRNFGWKNGCVKK